jgi:Flp pilus assembly protein TadB
MFSQPTWFLLAAQGLPPGLLEASSILVGLAVALVAGMITHTATSPRNDEHLTPSELERRTALRKRSLYYRWFEPFIDDLAAWCERKFPRQMELLQRDLDLVYPDRTWRSSEYLAVSLVESWWLFAIGGMFGYVLGDSVGVVPAGLLGYLIGPALAVRTVTQRARLRLARIRSRLPFTVDLMALMLESGAIFQDCLEKAAEENADHPLGEELERVCSSIARGRPRVEALREMAVRLDDVDVNELVFCINTADETTGKLKDALRDLAEQMRTRRVQWLERAAEEAKVQITWPGFLIMLACLLIVAAPLLLPTQTPSPP